MEAVSNDNYEDVKTTDNDRDKDIESTFREIIERDSIEVNRIRSSKTNARNAS